MTRGDKAVTVAAVVLASLQTWPDPLATAAVVVAVGIAYFSGRGERVPDLRRAASLTAAQGLIVDRHDLWDEVKDELDTPGVVQRFDALVIEEANVHDEDD